MKLTSYVIHLERATDRRANVDKLCTQLPGKVIVLNAIDSKQLDTVAIDSFYKKAIHKPVYPFALRSSEIACFSSYRLAWQMLVDSDEDYCLIVEVDTVLDIQKFSRALELALSSADSYSYVRFPIKDRESVKDLISYSAEIKHYSSGEIGLGMVVQLVGREAAKQLLSISKVIDRLVDTLMQLGWITGISPTVVFPNGVSEISNLSFLQRTSF